MQPYIFPYIGYFQLISSVDKFVILDDVSFINRGWINRNNILINGAPKLFTIPLRDASQNKRIIDIEIADNLWKSKFIRTIEMAYRKAPHFDLVFPMVESMVNFEMNNISGFIRNSLIQLCNYFEINTVIVESSSKYNCTTKGQSRILEICKKESATIYYNPIGGVELYSKDLFSQNQIELWFVKPRIIPYNQMAHEFVPWLSIIDVCMFNSKDRIKELLKEFDLV